MQPYVIGIDIGTGSTKAVAMNSSGYVEAVSQFYYSTIKTTPGYSEQDPLLIWEAFIKCINNIIEILQAPPVIISLSSCMHSLIIMDSNHDPITNSITWADTRSEKIAGALRQSPTAEAIYRETGTPIHAMSPLCKIIWFKDQVPEIFKLASKFISIKEFIWHKLFDVYETDQSIASATGLFSITQCSWYKRSLDLCNISETQLSEIVATDFKRNGLTASSLALLNIPADVPFCIGASDGCLAVIGSYADEHNIAALTIGTSGAIRVASPVPVYTFPEMTFNYVLDSKTFICGGAVNNGGNVLGWMMQVFLQNSAPGSTDFTSVLNSIVTIKPGCDGLLFLPYLNGERAPIWDEQSCGVYFGIRSHHTTSHFLRAGIEGICFALCHVLQQIESSTIVIDQLHVSGKVTHSEVWLQVLADISGKKIAVLQTDDASAIGAAFLGMKAINIVEKYPSFKQPGEPFILPAFSNHGIYKKYFELYKDLYSALKESMHRMYHIKT